MKLISTVLLILLAIILSSCSKPGQALGFAYEKQGDEIHFTGGQKNGWFSTQIDDPSGRVIDGFQGALGRNVIPTSSVDAASFVPMSEEYCKDKDKVMYKWISPGIFLMVDLSEADVATFKPINFCHAIDKNSIWYMDKAIQGSDPASAVILDNRTVKDANSVYISGEKQNHLDAASFEKLGSAYFKDINAVYWGAEPVNGADPDSFSVMGDSFFAKDKQSVFRSGALLPNLDASTCKFIFHDPYGYQLVSDKNGVYLNGLKFLHADPIDFTMIDKRSAKGGKYLFYVDSYHSTPVTLYKQGNQLIVETILYDRQNRAPLAIAKADLINGKMSNLQLLPLASQKKPLPVPDWQQGLFMRNDLANSLMKASKALK